MTACPRCGEGVARSQEYCLECGLHLPGSARFAAPGPGPRQVIVPLLVAAVVAVGGAAAAIALTRDTATATPVLTATGGSEAIPASTVAAESALADWPAGTSGWTNILISIPKVDGRDGAVARANEAQRKGLRRVGVLDSSRYASLHPGYWVVFAGVYPSRPDATSRLREARSVQRGAHTERVER